MGSITFDEYNSSARILLTPPFCSCLMSSDALIVFSTYGVVMKARHKLTGQLVAIKQFKESDEDEQVRKTALREIRILKQLKHENIVALLEVFRRNGKLYLVFEYVERTILEDLEKNTSGLDKMDVKKIFFQLLKALQFIHSHNVIHRSVISPLLSHHIDAYIRSMVISCMLTLCLTCVCVCVCVCIQRYQTSKTNMNTNLIINCFCIFSFQLLL